MCHRHIHSNGWPGRRIRRGGGGPPPPPPAELEAYFIVADLDRLTDHTLTDRELLKAELARVAEQGWAMVDQELEEGLRSVAAPIHGADGRVVAAVNLSTHASRTTAEAVRAALVPPLLATAAAISDDLSSAGPAKAARG